NSAGRSPFDSLYVQILAIPDICTDFSRKALGFTGRASRVTDPALVARIAKIYQDGGWPAQVSDDGTSLTAQYSAPSAGPPPYMIYQVIPRTVFALGAAEPYGATSFRFQPGNAEKFCL